jgi:hypothetical protein
MCSGFRRLRSVGKGRSRRAWRAFRSGWQTSRVRKEHGRRSAGCCAGARAEYRARERRHGTRQHVRTVFAAHARLRSKQNGGPWPAVLPISAHPEPATLVTERMVHRLALRSCLTFRRLDVWTFRRSDALTSYSLTMTPFSTDSYAPRMILSVSVASLTECRGSQPPAIASQKWPISAANVRS